MSSPSPSKFVKVMKHVTDDLIYYTIRAVFICIGFYIGYYITTSRITPVLNDMCLTDTQKCMTIEVYRSKNTFVGREDISQIWFWFNGRNLYVYGQAPGTCMSPSPSQPYAPVNVFQLKLVNNSLKFITLPNQCIDNYTTIINFYKNTLNVPQERFMISRSNMSNTSTIYDIIQNMYDNNIFIL